MLPTGLLLTIKSEEKGEAETYQPQTNTYIYTYTYVSMHELWRYSIPQALIIVKIQSINFHKWNWGPFSNHYFSPLGGATPMSCATTANVYQQQQIQFQTRSPFLSSIRVTGNNISVGFTLDLPVPQNFSRSLLHKLPMPLSPPDFFEWRNLHVILVGSTPPSRMQSSPPGWHYISLGSGFPILKPSFSTVTERGGTSTSNVITGMLGT